MYRLWKRFLSIALLFLLLFSCAYAEPETTSEVPVEEEPPQIEYYTDDYGITSSAKHAIVIDADSGKVLYERNAEETHLIASTTKIMTALVALRHTPDLDTYYTIDAAWTGIEGSSMYLVPGESVSMRALLYGLMLNSGNDAATAIANIVGGDEETFVSWMNAEAKRLGMKKTSFSNPHGLDADNHYSTAHDMAKLMAEAMKNDDFREITHTRYINIDNHELYFHNKLLNLYEYCISGKTGYTIACGRTLVTASEKDGLTLIAVTLDAPDDWNDQIKMYDFAYKRYGRTTYNESGDYYGYLRLQGTNQKLPICYATTNSVFHRLDDHIKRTVYIPESITKSVARGDVVGSVVYTINDEVVSTAFLVANGYANIETGEVSDVWKNEFKNSYRLAGLYPDVQPSDIYRMEGLLSTAFSHSWE